MGQGNYFSIFRYTAILEGISFLLLLFFAMPMKYLYQEPEYVKIVGMIHGLLFIALLLLAVYGSKGLRGKLGNRVFAVILISSLLPFGTLIADYKYMRARS